MASVKFIMSVKNGLIQKSSKVAGKYMGHADNVPLETKLANSTFRDKELFHHIRMLESLCLHILLMTYLYHQV